MDVEAEGHAPDETQSRSMSHIRYCQSGLRVLSQPVKDFWPKKQGSSADIYSENCVLWLPELPQLDGHNELQGG